MAAEAPALSDLLGEFDLDRSSVQELHQFTRAAVVERVAEIADLLAAGDDELALPVVSHEELATLDDDRIELIRRRACVVVRGTFDRAQADAWNTELGAYLDANRYADLLAEREPDRAASGSGISPIFWSKPQVAARQHPRMVEVRTFLNSLWTPDSVGDRHFDAHHDIGYADRVRWRPPGVNARGLALHCDSAATAGWRDPENHRVFAHVLGGCPDNHDPWDASHRVGRSEHPDAAAGVFRTFQGWTALTPAHPSDGALQIVPIPLAAPYLIVRGLAMELGVFGEPEPTPPRMRGGATVEPAAVSMPVMEPGDTIWWHGDLLHAVQPATNDTRWSNVMYVGSSPRCPRNDAYNAQMRAWFEAGDSPPDFFEGHYERTFAGRATVDDLNTVGRQQLGYEPILTY